MFNQLERKIIGTLNQIESGKKTSGETNIRTLLSMMEKIDVPAYEKFSDRLEKAIRTITN